MSKEEARGERRKGGTGGGQDRKEGAGNNSYIDKINGTIDTALGRGILLLDVASREASVWPIHSSSRSSLPAPTTASAYGTDIPILAAGREGNGLAEGRGNRRERRQIGGSFTSMDFSIQSNGIREVKEARVSMLAFTRYFDIPWALKRCPSPLTPHTVTYIPPCTNLIGVGN